MAETGWTKGPWTVGEPDQHGQAVVRGEHIEIATCWHHSVGAIEKEMHCNARLIAAAPDMVEALEAHQEWADKERAGPQYPAGVSRDAPGGEAIWRAWWNEQLDLCDRANTLTRTALARARGQEQERK